MQQSSKKPEKYCIARTPFMLIKTFPFVHASMKNTALTVKATARGSACPHLKQYGNMKPVR